MLFIRLLMMTTLSTTLSIASILLLRLFWSSGRILNKVELKIRRFILVCIFCCTSMYQNIPIGTSKPRNKNSSDILIYFSVDRIIERNCTAVTAEILVENRDK